MGSLGSSALCAPRASPLAGHPRGLWHMLPPGQGCVGGSCHLSAVGDKQLQGARSNATKQPLSLHSHGSLNPEGAPMAPRGANKHMKPAGPGSQSTDTAALAGPRPSNSRPAGSQLGKGDMLPKHPERMNRRQGHPG